MVCCFHNMFLHLVTSPLIFVEDPSGPLDCRLQRRTFRKGDVIIDQEDTADRPQPAEMLGLGPNCRGWEFAVLGISEGSEAFHRRVWLSDGSVW